MTAPDPTAGEHDFLPVNGHPDDDECTHRADGTDATYCGRPKADHEHHPNCYQRTGVPDDLPEDLCDCRVLRMLDASPPAVAESTGTSEDAEALAEVLAQHLPDPRLHGAWCQCGWKREGTGFPSQQWAAHLAAVIASDWLAAQKAAARAEIVAGVRAWCAINEIAAPPLDWEGLGEFLVRVAREVRP